MRKIAITTLTLAVLGLCLMSNAADAQTPNLKPKIYLGGGLAPILGPDAVKDNFDPSYTFMGAVGLPFSIGFSVMPKVHYHKYKAKSGVTMVDPDFLIFTIGADITYTFAPPVSPAKPYFLIGAGSMSFSADSGDESNFYFNAGAGIDISVGPTFALFGEAKWTYLNTDGESVKIFPVVLGIRLL